MQGLELMALKNKFKRIQELNSEVFRLVDELTDEEYKLFLESEYVWPIDTKPSNRIRKLVEEGKAKP
jgi:hypothetical protein